MPTSMAAILNRFTLMGIKKGIDVDRAELIVKIMRKNGFTYDQAVELMDLNRQDRERYRAEVKKRLSFF